MATKKRTTKKKAAPAKRKKKAVSTGLRKFRTYVSKRTRSTAKKVSELERKLKAAKKEKARKTKIAIAGYKKANR